MPNPITAAARALFGRSPSPQTIRTTQEVGVSGTAIFGGFVQVLERNPKLVGENRYRITSDIFLNTSIVAAGIRYFLDLCAKPTWSVEPADDSAEAKEAAEFADSALYDLTASWSRTVRKAAEFRFHGFGIQEWTAKVRDDGRIGFESIEARPQHTIWRWEVDDRGTILGMYQRNPLNGQEIFLPRQKVIYLVDDTMTDSPEGCGILRHIVEPAERLREYLRLEGKGFETDLRGIPVARAPLADLAAAVKSGSITQTVADAIKKPLVDFIQNHIRSDKSGLLLDSKPYFSQGDNQTPSATPTTSVELLNGDAAAFAEIGKAIERINHELAVILGVENMLLGSSGQAGGSRALSQDKSEHLYLVVNSCLGDIAEGMERDFLGPLWLLNGLDPALKPTLKCEDVQYKDVAEITTALQQMAQAGAMLAPDDPAIDDVRSLLGISPMPEPSPDVMGVRTGVVPGADFGQSGVPFDKRRRHHEREEGGNGRSAARPFGEFEFDPAAHPRGAGGRFIDSGAPKGGKFANLERKNLYSLMADAEDNGGDVKGLAASIIEERPDLEESVISNARDLGYTIKPAKLKEPETPSTFHETKDQEPDGAILRSAESLKAGEPMSGEQAQALYDAGKIPEGWYVHGRSTRLQGGDDPLDTGYVIQMTRDLDVARQYAHGDGSIWYISPKADAKTLDLQDIDGVDGQKVKKAFVQSFDRGMLPSSMDDWLANSSASGTEDADEAWNAIKSAFSPSDIVNSAEAYDDPQAVIWLNEATGAEFIHVGDGAIAINIHAASRRRVTAKAAGAISGFPQLSITKVPSLKRKRRG